MTTARDVIARAVGNWEGNPGDREEYEWTADRVLTALEQAGWVVVPREPTFVSKAEERRYRMSAAKGGWYDGKPCPRCGEKSTDDY